MWLQILLLHLFQVALVESLEVRGYLGETITLPSQANPSWTLSKIEWSVFSNTTWIATYRSGKKVTERFYLYKGRLELNITSGDLMIRNVTTMDAMEYSVNLINTQGLSSVNKVKLIVKQLPQKPGIQNVTKTPINGGCWVGLICSSSEIGVDLSWKVEPPNVNVFSMSNSSNSAALLAFINTNTTHVKFTCISRRATDQTPSDITLKCDDGKPQPGPSPLPVPIPCRCRHLAYFTGGMLTVLMLVILYCLKEQIKHAWEYVRAKYNPSTEE